MWLAKNTVIARFRRRGFGGNDLPAPGPLFLVVAAVILGSQKEPELRVEALIRGVASRPREGPSAETVEHVGPPRKPVFRRHGEPPDDRRKLRVGDLHGIGRDEVAGLEDVGDLLRARSGADQRSIGGLEIVVVRPAEAVADSQVQEPPAIVRVDRQSGEPAGDRILPGTRAEPKWRLGLLSDAG